MRKAPLSACQELSLLAAHATQIFSESSADSITSSTLPDPDTFAIHMTRQKSKGSVDPPALHRGWKIEDRNVKRPACRIHDPRLTIAEKKNMKAMESALLQQWLEHYSLPEEYREKKLFHCKDFASFV